MALTGSNAGSGSLQGLYYGGQATVVANPVSSTVAATVGAHVQSTGLEGVCSYTTPEGGLFRVEALVQVNNGVSGNDVTLEVVYTDAVTGTAETLYFMAGATALNGATAVANGFVAPAPILVNAAPNSAIVVNYNDPTNTPNDVVSVAIHRVTSTR